VVETVRPDRVGARPEDSVVRPVLASAECRPRGSDPVLMGVSRDGFERFAFTIFSGMV
jgi:hypothetical protein